MPSVLTGVKVALFLVPVLFRYSTSLLPLPHVINPILELPNEYQSNFVDITQKYGYYAEEHTVTTEDGYLLTLHRLRNTTCQWLSRPALLMHGLLLSSDTWLDSGPRDGLPYLLADTCYDLWLGNFRGNYLGRQHVRLNPDTDVEFWDFSYDDMGLYDLPAIIDYVLKETGDQKLNYIGYSQGGGTFAIMCSERPEYRLKVSSFVGLAPAITMKYTRSLVYRYFAGTLARFWKETKTLGIYEVLYKGSLIQRGTEAICGAPGKIHKLCLGALSFIDDYDPGSIEPDTVRSMYTHLPAGTSVKNFVKYSQAMEQGTFQKFDYGKSRNLIVYGNETAPFYDLSYLDMPSLLVTGKSDNIVDIRDVTLVHKQLKKSHLFVVKNEKWNHFDVPYSSFTPELVFPAVHRHLQRHGTQ
ncbi:lipase 3 [Plutella xylostella]|uniref:lipase 3 n=1 Tax=Plutella xylostella TaxID=51655 RepID=UPI002032CFCA|nr:lipase 3 [Plutella xylostella]